MGILSRMTAPVRRLFTGRPTSVTPEAHVQWLREQVANYVTKQYYTSPLSADLNFTGETWEMRKAYRKFAFKEPAIKAPLLKKVLSVASLDPTVKPAKGGGQKERDAATFVDETISESEGGWPNLIFTIGVMSLIDGFSLSEKVFKVHEHGHKRGLWGLDRLAPKDTEHLRFNLDRFRHVTEIRNMSAGQGGILFEPADFVLYTHLPILGSPFGVSDLRAANRAAQLIEAAVKLRSMLLENYSGPFLSYKRGSTIPIEQAKAVLAEARNNGYIIYDAADELEVLNLATSSPAQFEDAIEDLRKEAATAIGGSYLHLYESSSPQGNAETHKGVSELGEWWLSTTLCSAINTQLVPDLVYPNFGWDCGLPTVSLGAVDIAEVLRNIEMVKGAQEINLPVSAEHVRELIPLEAPRYAGDVLEPKALPAPGGGTSPVKPQTLPPVAA